MGKEFGMVGSDRARKIGSDIGFFVWDDPTDDEKKRFPRVTHKVAACREDRYAEYVSACDAAGIPESERGKWIED